MRYLKLYSYFLRFSFSKAMEFRVDFFFRIIMDINFYLIQFLFFKIIYLHTPLLAGWGIEQMTIFIAGYIFIDALNMTVFSTNAWYFPIYINRGDLDYYLTKPVSSLFFLSFKEFAANSFVNLLISIYLLFWAISNYSTELSALKITVYLFLLLNGTLLYFLLQLLFLLSVFWTQSPRGFGDVFFSVAHTLERPDRIFKGVTRILFTYILPFSLMASYPAKFLLEDISLEVILTITAVTFSLFAVVIFVWRRGLKNYSSASS